jgi:pimeloyl-ACP methyl ester carboxylesterase
MDQATNVRQLPAQFDERGNPFWTTRMSTPDDSYAQIAKVPNRVIPVIFVPGVMGSNLLGTGSSEGVTWLLDSAGSMSGWLSKGAEYRKQHLRPEVMVVADDGKLPSDTRLPPAELKRRGWGEVGFMSYGAALSWFENQLNDYDQADTGERSQLRQRALQALQGEATLTDDEFELSYRYLLPVYACGYNWLDSNVASAERLGQLIDAVVQRYKQENKKCEKVILVTHSMGGLVARHCSEVLGYRDKIFGIVHGVMPDLGAAAVYRRFKAGTEGDLLASLVLGSNAAEMTAVLSSAPGPLQLLPTPEYGNGWLKIDDGKQTHSLPVNGDPYGEIYAVRGKWWSMCEDHLINPLNKETDPQKKALQISADWVAFARSIDLVQEFHVAMKHRYHCNTHAFFGSHTSNRAYGTVQWRSEGFRRLNVNALEGAADDHSETGKFRNVTAPVIGEPQVQGLRRFSISDPEEDGDGTVPRRSGIAPRAACVSVLQVNVGHEPAFKYTAGADNLRACRFTLRAIARIAQEVNKTELKYD